MTHNIFVVLGVARSGTSAIAKGLNALGVDLGSNFVDVDTKWNAKGFFEDSDIVYKINGRLFRALDFAPYGIEMLDARRQTSTAVSDIKLAAMSLLKQRFATTENWGFKDPSTVKLIPFWQDVFTAANINDNYVICLRNPLGSAKSYQKLTGCDLEIGFLLWLMHMYPAIADTQNRNRIVVSYEALLQNPRLQLQRMQNQFCLQSNANEINNYVNQFLDTKLHHNEFTREDLLNNPALKIAPLCLQLYDLLLQLAKDEIAFADVAFKNQWQQIENELQKIYPIYSYIDVLLKNNYQLKRSIQAVNKTFVWKLYAPIKSFYDQLRAKKRQIRNEKRLAKAYG